MHVCARPHPPPQSPLKADRVKGTLLQLDFAMEAINDPSIRIIKSAADVLPEYPVELLILRKQMLDEQPEAAGAITRAVIQACRHIVRNKADTLAVVRKYTPGMDDTVLNRAYDELLRIKGFGVDGGMTESNLQVAHDLALQNHQIDGRSRSTSGPISAFRTALSPNSAASRPPCSPPAHT